MPDGTGVIDNPTIVIPAGRLEAPRRNSREVLSTYFNAFLTPPERISSDLTRVKLSQFLSDSGYIRAVKP